MSDQDDDLREWVEAHVNHPLPSFQASLRAMILDPNSTSRLAFEIGTQWERDRQRRIRMRLVDPTNAGKIATELDDDNWATAAATVRALSSEVQELRRLLDAATGKGR